MFHMEREIRAWRQQLATSLAFDREDLDELESHLRDLIATKLDNDSDREDAFRDAVKAIGERHKIAGEYQKVNFGTLWARRAAVFMAILLFSIALYRQAPQEVSLTEKVDPRYLAPTFDPHLFEFRKSPRKSLKLPPVDKERARFFDVWLSHNDYTVLVLPGIDKDTLYVDQNNDYDLTNDESPFYFSRADNQLTLNFHDGSRDSLSVQVNLYRRPQGIAPDKIDRMINEDGSLHPQFRAWKKVYPGFTGAANTFYFGEKKILSTGYFMMGSDSVKIGLFDSNQNGRFDEAGVDSIRFSSDLLCVDVNRDGELNMHSHFEFFNVDEVFEIGSKRFRLADIRSDGSSLKIEQVDKAPSFTYYRQIHAHYFNELLQTTKFDAPFWEQSLKTLDGRTLSPDMLGEQHTLVLYRQSAKYFSWADINGETFELQWIRTHFRKKDLQIIMFSAPESTEEGLALINSGKINWDLASFDQPVAKETLKKMGLEENSAAALIITPENEVIQVKYGILNRFIFTDKLGLKIVNL